MKLLVIYLLLITEAFSGSPTNYIANYLLLVIIRNSQNNETGRLITYMVRLGYNLAENGTLFK